VALARKLLIALWRFIIDGVMPEGGYEALHLTVAETGQHCGGIAVRDPRERRRCPAWRLAPSSQSDVVPSKLSCPECGTVAGIVIRM
jgi:hypothetical protein